MYDKYEIRTYPENYHQENTESDSENEYTFLPFKKSTYIENNNQNNYYNNFNQNIYTKVRTNFDLYQSEPKNNFKKKKLKNKNKNKRIIQKTVQISYDSDIINNKNVIKSFNPNLNKNNFFKKKIDMIQEIHENRNGERIDLNKYFDLKRSRIKTYKTELNIEKSDNFNVLSYRPEEYESDYFYLKKNYKKQEASELFLPSKNRRAISHMTYVYSSNDTKKDTNKDKEKGRDKSSKYLRTTNFEYEKQNYYLKYDMRPKKKICQAKSTSKCKVSQLKDFNIEKLIEIGDNEGNKWQNILSFGKKIQDLKNQNINKIKKKKKINNKYRINIVDSKNYINTEIPKPYSNNFIENKKIVSNRKKVVYHGQIKRKKNINKNQEQNQTANNMEMKIENDNNINNNIRNTTNNKINSNNNFKKYSLKQHLSMNKNTQNLIKRTKKLNNKNNDINNSNNIRDIIISANRTCKSMIKSNPIIDNNLISQNNINNQQCSDFFYQSQNNNNVQNINKKAVNNNPIINNIKASPRKNKNGLNLNNSTNINTSNNKFYYSVKNFDNVENILEKNKYLNYAKKNGEQFIKKEISKKNLLTEKNDINFNKNNNNKEIIKDNNINIKEQDYINGIKYNQKQQKQNLNNDKTKDVNKLYQKEIINKRYYGYDDRHNLEGTVNNHSLYASVYSKKSNKIN